MRKFFWDQAQVVTDDGFEGHMIDNIALQIDAWGDFNEFQSGLG